MQKESLLNEQEILEIQWYLTEPLPNQRMIDFTKTILRLSRHISPNLEEVSILHTTCFFQSANEWHFKIIKLIVDHFKFSTIKLAEFLSNAASLGHNKCTKHLIEANAEVNMKTEDGSTALKIAAQNGHSDIVKYLIEVKANVNLQAEDGGTALIIAAQNRHSDIIKYLIEANADVNMKTK